MTNGKKWVNGLLAVLLGSTLAGTAVAQITTRFVNPGLATTSTKIVPGAQVPFEVRLDAPTTQTIGVSFTLTQNTPAANGFFSITGRDFTGSIYGDTSSGTSDAVVLNPPSNLLDPLNGDNLGRNTVGLVPAAAGSNIFIVGLTLTSSGTTPLGTYTIIPGAPESVFSDDAFNDLAMSATFTIIVGQTLTVTKTGTGTGTVTADSGAINCGATCSDIYPGTLVTLTATPTGGSTFVGWSGGGCSGTGTCAVTVNATTAVTAQFAPPQFQLTVAPAGSGGGVVSSVPPGILCPGDCTELYDQGTVVTLTAAPNVGSVFAGWSGAGCSGTGTCVVTMNAAATATATFNIQTFSLTVNKTGAGTGTVTGSPPSAINCGATCSDPALPANTVITLTATPTGADVFTGWSGGGCSGTGTCVVTLASNTTVTANFAPSFSITVTKAGTGAAGGTVTSSPAGINCGATCSAPFGSGQVVTLTAAVGAGTTFTGWSGAGCSGTGTCVITVAAAATVTATFTTQQFLLTAAKAGNGSGTVTSSPPGINCGATCSSLYDFNTVVTLTATPAAFSTFSGWSGGGCSGTGTCVVTVTVATTVTATFVDTVPPTTQITGFPPNPSNNPSPQFTFTSNEPGTFECSLDGAPFTACSTPYSVLVGNGTHTFTVRAVDGGGNVDPMPPSYTWLVAGVVANVLPVPTLGEWGLLLMSLLLGAAGLVVMRRRG